MVLPLGFIRWLMFTHWCNMPWLLKNKQISPKARTAKLKLWKKGEIEMFVTMSECVLSLTYYGFIFFFFYLNSEYFQSVCGSVSYVWEIVCEHSELLLLWVKLHLNVTFPGCSSCVWKFIYHSLSPSKLQKYINNDKILQRKSIS